MVPPKNKTEHDHVTEKECGDRRIKFRKEVFGVIDKKADKKELAALSTKVDDKINTKTIGAIVGVILTVTAILTTIFLAIRHDPETEYDKFQEGMDSNRQRVTTCETEVKNLDKRLDDLSSDQREGFKEINQQLRELLGRVPKKK